MESLHFLTCPHCHSIETLASPVEATTQFHQCVHCKKPYKASKNDCCILCSFGNRPCNQIEQNLAL
jgi:hypothetical protein